MVTLTLLALLVVVVVARVGGRRTGETDTRLALALGSHAAVALVFLVTVGVLLYTWADWHPSAVVHDELAYVLQANIFARGLWALPSPALPLFFEQPYVLVEPTLASKYFPGHSILLAIGALVGWMPLVPLLLQGAAACFLFVLARRVANGAVALGTWLIWLSTPMVLYFGPSYYSESTTIVCWLAGWYALLEWRGHRRLRDLLAVALCAAWCVLTRPLTGLAYAIPVGIVVLHDVAVGRRWRDFVLAMAAGSLVLAIIPLWSLKTTGDWRVTPLQRYTLDYMPFDLPGFGLVTTPPARPLNREFVQLNQLFSAFHPGHVPAALPALLLARARYLAASIWGPSGALLGVFALIGALTLDRRTLFAVASGILLLLTYLSFGATPTWTLYYYESVPVYAYLTSAGIAWSAAAIGARRLPRIGDPALWRSTRWSTALVAGLVVLCVPAVARMNHMRRTHIMNRVHLVRFAQLRESIPGARVLLLVQYAAWHNTQESYVQNVANPEAERLLVAYDRGESENARLVALMPDRTPYLFDEGNGTVFRYPTLSRP